jgi:prevent-host-death family protein
LASIAPLGIPIRSRDKAFLRRAADSHTRAEIDDWAERVDLATGRPVERPEARWSKSSRSSRKTKRKHGSAKKARRTRTVALAKVKDDFSRYLKLASGEEIVVTRHGRPAGVLIGFGDEEAWFDYRLENHPEFLDRVRRSREDLSAGRGSRLEEVRD